MSNDTTQNRIAQNRQSELRDIRSDLREKLLYVSRKDDTDRLWAEAQEWILESFDLPVGSVESMVRSRLMDLRAEPEHKFVKHRGVKEAEDAFPDACQDCPHYGNRCPILARKTGRDTLDRIFTQSENDEELIAALSELAAKHHCDILNEQVTSWRTDYSTFIKRGERLRMRVSAAVSDIDLSEFDDSDIDLGIDEDLPDPGEANTAPGLGGSPPSEQARTTEQVVADVMADGEEDE